MVNGWLVTPHVGSCVLMGVKEAVRNVTGVVLAFARTTSASALHSWTYWQGYRRPSFAAYVFDAGS